MTIAHGEDCIGCGSRGRVLPEGLLQLRRRRRIGRGDDLGGMVAADQRSKPARTLACRGRPLGHRPRRERLRASRIRPATRSPAANSLLARWHRRPSLASLAIREDGFLYGEWDVLAPHPSQRGQWIEMVVTWGKPPRLKSEPRLIAMPA